MWRAMNVSALEPRGRRPKRGPSGVSSLGATAKRRVELVQGGHDLAGILPTTPLATACWTSASLFHHSHYLSSISALDLRTDFPDSQFPVGGPNGRKIEEGNLVVPSASG
jgi:hypothetical protein